jgi:hypothetical protein
MGLVALTKGLEACLGGLPAAVIGLQAGCEEHVVQQAAEAVGTDSGVKVQA